jgi:hypothetical protein
MGMSKSPAEICAKDQVETVLTAGEVSNRPFAVIRPANETRTPYNALAFQNGTQLPSHAAFETDQHIIFKPV